MNQKVVFRSLILVILFLLLAKAIHWVVIVSGFNPGDVELSTTFAILLFMIVFYLIAPISIGFLVKSPSENQALVNRLNGILDSLTWKNRVILFDHEEKYIFTTGLLTLYSCTYLSTGMLKYLSEDGLKGVLAHELTHVREHHILLSLITACVVVLVVHPFELNFMLLTGFFIFLAIRRLLEYRADVGSAKLVGKQALLKSLFELSALKPTNAQERWFVFAQPYPTLSMRIRALETGMHPLF
ncbi:MAG: M48 family metalloprotease [Methylophilaceae bacterium]|nr:M48 family metalloprotease [Methylophilaceae bacterium]